jgi:hypothetical protein
MNRYIGRMTVVVYIVVCSVALVVTAAIAVMLCKVCYAILQFVSQRIVRFTRGRIDPGEWTTRVRKATPHNQAVLLRVADPSRFGLDIEPTIDLVGSLEPDLQQEPALSAFNAKLTELLALRRQRRTD